MALTSCGIDEKTSQQPTKPTPSRVSLPLVLGENEPTVTATPEVQPTAQALHYEKKSCESDEVFGVLYRDDPESHQGLRVCAYIDQPDRTWPGARTIRYRDLENNSSFHYGLNQGDDLIITDESMENILITKGDFHKLEEFLPFEPFSVKPSPAEGNEIALVYASPGYDGQLILRAGNDQQLTVTGRADEVDGLNGIEYWFPVKDNELSPTIGWVNGAYVQETSN